MAREIYAHGKIIKGDFNDCYVFWMGPDLWYVVSDGVTSGGWEVKGPIYKIGFLKDFLTPNDCFKFMKDNKKYEITTAKIDRITDAASFQTTPNASAFVDGALTAGVGYGMAKAMASVRSGKTLAVYTTDGKKMLIEFRSTEFASQFQNDLFKL